MVWDVWQQGDDIIKFGKDLGMAVFEPGTPSKKMQLSLCCIESAVLTKFLLSW